MSHNNGQEKEIFVQTKSSTMDYKSSWLILSGCCLCCIITKGIPSNIGVLYVNIQNNLNVSLIETSVVGSLQTGCLFFTAIIACPLARRIGCRVTAITGAITTFVACLVSALIPSLYVFYVCLGVIAGVGFSVTYSSAIVFLNDNFVERRSFAILTFYGASGIGMLSFGPLTSYLLYRYDLEGTLLIMSSINLNCIVGAMLFLPSHIKDRNTDFRDNESGRLLDMYLDKELWKNPLLYLMLLSAFGYGNGHITAITLLPEYMASKGFPLSTAALSITTIGITSTAMRFVMGFTSNKLSRLNRQLFVIAGISAGCSLFAILFCKSTAEYLSIAGLFGIFYGAVSGLNPILLVEFMGAEKLPVSLGAFMMVFGVGTFIGSPVAGILAENVSINGVEFVFGGSGFLLCGIAVLPSLFVAFCQIKTRQDNAEDIIVDETQHLISKKQNYDITDRTVINLK